MIAGMDTVKVALRWLFRVHSFTLAARGRCRCEMCRRTVRTVTAEPAAQPLTITIEGRTLHPSNYDVEFGRYPDGQGGYVGGPPAVVVAHFDELLDVGWREVPATVTFRGVGYRGTAGIESMEQQPSTGRRHTALVIHIAGPSA